MFTQALLKLYITESTKFSTLRNGYTLSGHRIQCSSLPRCTENFKKLSLTCDNGYLSMFILNCSILNCLCRKLTSWLLNTEHGCCTTNSRSLTIRMTSKT